jgi:hypothetical protein
MPRPKRGLLSRRGSKGQEVVNQILNLGEYYRGTQITAASLADLVAKRAAIDRSIAKRLFDAPDAASRALILAEEKALRPAPQPRPPRRSKAEAESAEE